MHENAFASNLLVRFFTSDINHTKHKPFIDSNNYTKTLFREYSFDLLTILCEHNDISYGK